MACRRRRDLGDAAMTTHVFFNASAGHFAREHLRNSNSTDESIFLPDDLSWGPITNLSGAVRLAWARPYAFYDWTDDELKEEADRIDEFWSTASTLEHDFIIWMHAWNSTDVCGVGAFLSMRLRGVPVSVVDVAGQRHPRANEEAENAEVISLSQLTTDELFGMTQLCATWGDEAETMRREQWTQAVQANKPLRAIEDGKLISARENYYDARLLSYVTQNWKIGADPVARVMSDLWNEQSAASSEFLFARLRSLVEQGVVEAEGGAEQVPTTRVRLRA